MPNSSSSPVGTPLAQNPKTSAPEKRSGILDAVVKIHPRLAVFDCDGTLWSGDGGKDFLYWEIENKIIPDEVAAWAAPRYASYKQGLVEEAQMCGEMVALHAGLKIAELQAAAERFFLEVLEPRIFAEMRELMHRLMQDGCEVWAVSSTNEWVIKAGCRRFGIPPERVLAACVKTDGLNAGGTLIRVPTGAGKAEVIRELICRQPDVVFGNSVHDAAMLECAKHSFVIHPSEELKAFAAAQRWPVFYPE